MDGGTLYSIGDVARRTGMTVKTSRFYSDCGSWRPLTVTRLTTDFTTWMPSRA
jgi:hypothetical protein